MEEVYRRYLQFAERHPRKYRLVSGPMWTEVMGPDRPRPIQDWLQARLAARFGGLPQDYAGVFQALFLLCHGAASLLTVSKHRRAKAEIKENCMALCDLLLKNVDVFRKREECSPGINVSKDLIL